MQTRLKQYTYHPVTLMITSVVLWMLYPPIVNYLIDVTSVLYVAASAHFIAAVATLLLTFIILFKKYQFSFNLSSLVKGKQKILLLALLTGSLSFSTHLLLYASLDLSTEFDVIAILIYETWPILFFIIDSFLRRDRTKVSINDFIFSGAAFSGFVVLTAPNLDLADWILLDSPMLKTMGLALLGGFTMAVTCYFRMKCMDVWSEISEKENLGLNVLQKGILTEAGSRITSAVLLAVTFAYSGEALPTITPTIFILLAFVGIGILAIGSLLYDLSVYRAENASISTLWYLMPVGAVAVIALSQSRLLTQYEAVAAVLIVASNIFLGLKYSHRSSLTILFVFVCSVGMWILFSPVSPIETYYDVLAVSTIFFVLLATFALERATSLNREREKLLGSFNKQVISFIEENDKNPHSDVILPNMKSYVLLTLHSFVRAFSNESELHQTQDRVEKLKYATLPLFDEQRKNRDSLLELFNTGDKLQTLESDRIPPEELVILFFLGMANVFFSLVFRPETLAASLFALVVSSSIMYLLLLIIERDKYTRIRYDHGLLCSNLIRYVQSKITASCENDAGTQGQVNIEKGVLNTINIKLSARESRASSYGIFSVFTLILAGFAYAFFIESIDKENTLEKSPFASSHNGHKTEINIALMDWPGAQIKGHILSEIINRYTEYDAKLIRISNKNAFNEMDESDGLVDIHPDIWMENNQALVRRYVNAYGTITIGDTFSYGSQGLCYTEFDTQKSNIKQHQLSMDDLKTPEKISMFDLSGNGKGDIWVGPKNWEATKIEQRRLSAYGLDNHYEYRIFDAEVFTQLLKRNNKKHIPSLFFCYYPDQIFTMENVHRVNDVKHDSQTWEEIIYQKIQPPNAHGISWPKTEIHIGFRSDLLQDFQELETLLNSFTIKNDDLIALLALQNEGHSPEEAANIWLNNNRDTVLAWFTGFQLSSSKKADALGVN